MHGSNQGAAGRNAKVQAQHSTRAPRIAGGQKAVIKSLIRREKSYDEYVSLRRRLEESEKFLHSRKLISRLEIVENAIRQEAKVKQKSLTTRKGVLKKKLKPIKKHHTPDVRNKLRARDELVEKFLLTDYYPKQTIVHTSPELPQPRHRKNLQLKSITQVSIPQVAECQSSSRSSNKEASPAVEIKFETPVKFTKSKSFLHRVFKEWKSAAE
eukprot:TRINITY_DN13434_c0_g1_i1.p1 TRINITY_DN13434_c0_g1~~TRINITY_DN13434_c0_g1_i1.p1  ORF type:complete len:212 (-),score=45.57 TRINITY_DN13434_c0_g1_i1:101-736(-)